MSPWPARHAANAARQTLSLTRGDAALYLAVLLYTAAGLLLLAAAGMQEMSSHRLYLRQWTTMFVILMPLIALSVDAILVIHRFDRRRTLAFRRVFSPHRLACMLSGMALLMGLMVFQGTFTSIKNVLPALQGGFPHDRAQADIDAFLHFGIDPWRILHAVAGTDVVRRVLEWNYNVLWFLLCFGALFHVATSPRARSVRARYVVMFMLVWIVCGNVLAGLFLSAGPVFYGAVTGDEARFADLAAFLARSGGEFSSAHSYQNYLWRLHASGEAGFGSGISAFPSVHVGLIAMNAFFLADVSRRLGVAAFAYVGLIVASSVYLGWHYAIDGYVSLAVVGLLHVVCRRFMAAAPGPALAEVPAADTPAAAGVRALRAS